MASGVQLALSALRVVMMLAVCSGDSQFNEANPTNQLGPFGKVERYGSTEPWLLIGGQKRPISLLPSMGHPASLKLQIEAEGKQLLLILQKNEYFASSRGEPGAYPRKHRAQGGIHPGHGASPSQGTITYTLTHL